MKYMFCKGKNWIKITRKTESLVNNKDEYNINEHNKINKIVYLWLMISDKSSIDNV